MITQLLPRLRKREHGGKKCSGTEQAAAQMTPGAYPCATSSASQGTYNEARQAQPHSLDTEARATHADARHTRTDKADKGGQG
jgi:hypothetical protein